jgi:Ca-activated chloride channel family protein
MSPAPMAAASPMPREEAEGTERSAMLSAPPAQKRGGFVSSVVGAVSGLFQKRGEAAEGSQGTPPPPMAPPPMPGASAPIGFAPMAGAPARVGGAADPTLLLEQQLASGLWEGPGGTDAARLLATAQALAACFQAQIDSSHPTFGAQIRKAVEAVCKLAAELAKKGESGREVKAALAAAFLVASGRRLRGQVTAAANDAGDASLQSFVASLTDADAAKGKLAELGVT